MRGLEPRLSKYLTVKYIIIIIIIIIITLVPFSNVGSLVITNWFVNRFNSRDCYTIVPFPTYICKHTYVLHTA